MSIDAELMAKLAKLEGVDEEVKRLKREGDWEEADALYTDEYDELEQALVTEFTPVIARLCKRRSIMIRVNGDSEATSYISHVVDEVSDENRVIELHVDSTRGEEVELSPED